MPKHRGIAIAESVKALRRQVEAWKAAGERVALVPTMGALHEGHISLVKVARRRRCRVVSSIFVNPTQFAPTEDFSKYPRTFDNDCAMLADASCDLVFAPQVAEMYPDGFTTTVTLNGPAKAGLEDRFRPTHFDGVATVVAKLFTQCRPDIAIFGQKDYQQLMVVTRMARDLDLGVEVIGAPTVREKDGLAMSSRNRYLTSEERAQAALLPKLLNEATAVIRAGGKISEVTDKAAAALTAAGYAVDYVEVRHEETLAPVTSLKDGPLRILAAAKLGKTRLIDNLAVFVNPSESYVKYAEKYKFSRLNKDILESIECTKDEGAGMMECLLLLMRIEGLSMTEARHIIDVQMKWD
jgi:pantoate--beta-alanine ligase